MSNPWDSIDLSNYEKHMCLKNVYQLQSLNFIMKEQFDSYPVSSVMILGIAGGNGLEHITHQKYKKIYGVDVNQDYLTKCRLRYAHLDTVFKTIHADLSAENLLLPNTELLIANLLIEYIGYECFQKVVKIVNPKYVSCVIQINTDDSFVSDSPYIHSFDCLDKVHHQMEEKELMNHMQEIGYQSVLTKEKSLPNGKKLIRIDFTN